MGKQRQRSRQIVLFVEGDTERGDARHRTLPTFFHKWLDPQLPEFGKVGIRPVKFQGASDYLDSLAGKLELHLQQGRANFVVGLLDLYGLPPEHIDLTGCNTVQEKVARARDMVRRLVPEEYKNRFRQHFAVHEVEAWLLAYPEKWPADVRKRIEKRPPEQVNFNEPPAKFLKAILGGRYRKTVRAKNIFPFVDPQVAVNKCPFLKVLAEDLLEIAKRLK